MMGYYGNMMGDFGLFGSLFSFVVFIDLVLLGIWLWKKIKDK